jgi:hypothetical protein
MVDLLWWLNRIPALDDILVLVSLLVVRLAVPMARRQLVRRRWEPPRSSATQGRLLLGMEVDGKPVAHIALLPPANGRRSTLVWPVSQIDPDDIPYAPLVALPFTHLIVKRLRDEPSLVSVSVVDRSQTVGVPDFFWVREATIGSRPGFPRRLLLPQNLVLRYVDPAHPANDV